MKNINYVSPSNEGKHIVLVWFFFHFFCFFSAKLVRTITFLSFQIGQWYLVCECMTIRWCVAYRNDLHVTLTFDLRVKWLFFRGDISFRYLKQFFLVYSGFGLDRFHWKATWTRCGILGFMEPLISFATNNTNN